jgi:uncharacterized protein
VSASRKVSAQISESTLLAELPNALSYPIAVTARQHTTRFEKLSHAETGQAEFVINHGQPTSSTMPIGTRNPGEFCWFNILTPQPALACEFFSRVLGWTYAEIPGMGHRAQVHGCEVGGIFDLAGPSAPPGTTPHMGGLLKVASADETVAKVISLGGQADPAFDIADQGRIAACTDPDGARFIVWQPGTFLGTDVDSMLHGAPSWFEVLTTDVGRATAFYSGVFGWTPEAMTPVPPGLINYTVFKLSGAPVAGMLQITALFNNSKNSLKSGFSSIFPKVVLPPD